MWICSRCRANNYDNANYCSNCGQNRKTQFQESKNTHTQSSKPSNTSNIKTKRNILIIAVCVITAVIIYNIYISKNSVPSALSYKPTYSDKTASIDSPFDVSISETVLFDEDRVKITAVHYEQSPSSGRYEDIIIYINNSTYESVYVSGARVKINGIVQKADTGGSHAEMHSNTYGMIRLDPEYINLSGNKRILSLEVSLYVSPWDVWSPYVKIPVVDNGTHKFYSTPVQLTLIDDEYVEASMLGYRIDDNKLYIYFYMKNNDNPRGLRSISSVFGLDSDSPAKTFIVNGVSSDIHTLWIGFYGREEYGFVVAPIPLGAPIGSLRNLEFAFEIYGHEDKTHRDFLLFSSESISLSFDNNGQLASADGAVTRHKDAWTEYYK